VAAGRQHVGPIHQSVVDVEANPLFALSPVRPLTDVQAQVKTEPISDSLGVAVQD